MGNEGLKYKKTSGQPATSYHVHSMALNNNNNNNNNEVSQ